jgi:hypothetical protein
LTVPRSGAKIFAVPDVGVRYPTAVSFREYWPTNRNPIISAVAPIRNQMKAFEGFHRKRLERCHVTVSAVVALEVERFLPEQGSMSCHSKCAIYGTGIPCPAHERTGDPAARLTSEPPAVRHERAQETSGRDGLTRLFA